MSSSTSLSAHDSSSQREALARVRTAGMNRGTCVRGQEGRDLLCVRGYVDSYNALRTTLLYCPNESGSTLRSQRIIDFLMSSPSKADLRWTELENNVLINEFLDLEPLVRVALFSRIIGGQVNRPTTVAQADLQRRFQSAMAGVVSLPKLKSYERLTDFGMDEEAWSSFALSANLHATAEGALQKLRDTGDDHVKRRSYIREAALAALTHACRETSYRRLIEDTWTKMMTDHLGKYVEFLEELDALQGLDEAEPVSSPSLTVRGLSRNQFSRAVRTNSEPLCPSHLQEPDPDTNRRQVTIAHYNLLDRKPFLTPIPECGTVEHKSRAPFVLINTWLRPTRALSEDSDVLFRIAQNTRPKKKLSESKQVSWAREWLQQPLWQDVIRETLVEHLEPWDRLRPQIDSDHGLQETTSRTVSEALVAKFMEAMSAFCPDRNVSLDPECRAVSLSELRSVLDPGTVLRLR